MNSAGIFRSFCHLGAFEFLLIRVLKVRQASSLSDVLLVAEK